jgi:hypothetical protein
MEVYAPIQPIVVIANNAIVPINTQYSFITFINQGAGIATLNWGAGNVSSLGIGQSLSMPYLGRTYGPMSIDATGTLVEALYVY